MGIPVTLNDADLLARYGMRFHPSLRSWKCRDLLARVCEAACYVQITGHVHPFYGDGSIASFALRAGVAAIPVHLNRETMAAYAVAFGEIAGLLNGDPVPEENTDPSVKTL